MLQFLYTDDYALDNHQSICTCDYSWPSGYNECLLCHELKNAGAQGICHFNVLMYIQADYFHIETLKLKALKRFQSYFKPFPASPKGRLRRLSWKYMTERQKMTQSGLNW